MKLNIKRLNFLVAICILTLSNCKKKSTASDPSPQSRLPIVVIDSITNISLTTATVSASISFDGGHSITDKGICWGTIANPTISNTKSSAGTGIDWFTTQVTGLVKGQVYYVRAYATNSEGTSYSDQRTVKAGTVVDIDGNVYDIVSIGGKTWIAGNLRVTKYRNGDPIQLVTDASGWKSQTAGAYCYVNNASSNTADYGLLYNWYAVYDTRGICPKGYRPTGYNEFSKLGGSSSGGTLKSTGTVFWKTPNDGATNSTGFSGKGTGWRDENGAYLEFNEINYFWDVEVSKDFATTATLFYNTPEFYTNWYNKDKNSGMSCRCVKQ